MAITMMGSKEAYEAARGTPEESNWKVVTDYKGHEAGRVLHGGNCPHAGTYDRSGALGPDCQVSCFVYGPLYMHTTHRGLVLDTGEHNYYDDSDFYAVVWNAEKGMPEHVEFASTRGWTYPNNACADATP
jgi:hypothetical protein